MDIPIRVLVTGSRELLPSDVNMIEIFDMFVEEGKTYQLIHGAAHGADTIAAREATRRGWNISCALPDWKTHGLAAGHIRNAQMVKQNPDIVVGFIKGISKGTKGCLKLAARCKSVKVIYLWDEGSIHIFTSAELGEYL